ncbi:MAG: Peptidase family [Amycolatopsis sp.]|uniref:M56 family metallopeptidase n=1 Tax=Amycolatopsis sp. TaxID=37632 RepID=UPI00262EAB84|nr:M56 family metallopeptidase [Amycolatopsis sp.]MCU1680383.1 Peptidase family [Amycolatopsis sp.]
MSIASCLLIYTAAVTVLAPRPLLRLTRSGVAPRLGVAAWLTAIGTVMAAGTVAVVMLAQDMARNWNRPGDTVLAACFALLRSVATGRYGVEVQTGLVGLTVVAAGAVAAVAWRLGRSLARARTSTHDHARSARLTGRRIAGVEAIVLDAPQRLAYCVAGRPHTIVVTSAAVDALDGPHLAAVLAHEQAHLSGRHHLILAATRGVAAILPRVGLFTTGASEVARLLEMCADDTAARRHGSRNVLTALLALSGVAPIPAGALGATGVGVLARAQRLAAPAAPARRLRTRLALTAVAGGVAAGPVLIGLLAATGLSVCGPMAC